MGRIAYLRVSPLLAGFLALALLPAAAQAAKKYPMTANGAVPAARGQVEVNTDKNSNSRVRLNVNYLAEPGSLTPPATLYIVWFQQNGSPPQNEGELKISKKRKGSFETVTPFHSFNVIVTAEQNHDAQSPTGPQVLTATIQH